MHQRILLTGATGFIGQHLYPALRAAGYHVRCASRDPTAAQAAHPEREWVALDLNRAETIPAALSGCDAALYLVHEMASGPGYAARERQSALNFIAAAEAASLRRVVYLGAVAPLGDPSPHLRSRLEVGALLRRGPTSMDGAPLRRALSMDGAPLRCALSMDGAPLRCALSTIEVRASMIIGAGSASWRMVRDLAVRLPFMILPRWLRNRSRPIAVDDVVAALLAALALPRTDSAWYDAPGPETLAHREMLIRVAALVGIRPRMIEVPFITPTLSSYWITLVTRCPHHIAQELVQGLLSDLVPQGDGIFALLPEHRRVPFDEAARAALLQEDATVGKAGHLFERLAHRTAAPSGTAG